MADLSREYLEEILALAKKSLPLWAYSVIASQARSRAGGRAAHRTDTPSVLEKIALSEIRPSVLRDMKDDELGVVWLRLHQWHANAKRRKQPIEDIVNAGLWVLNERKRRGLKVEESELVAEIEQFKDVSKARTFEKRIQNLPPDVVLVKDFISVVGSVAKGAASPSDIDVVVRADWDKDAGIVKIASQNVWLPVRNVLDPDKKGDLHWLSNQQGAHGDHIPVYDLILRRREKLEQRIVKSELVKVDLGCGNNKPNGYLGVDKLLGESVDTQCDLEESFPFVDDSVDEFRASHFLEHVEDKERIMSEIHRALKPGGEFNFEIPSTDGQGAFAHPDHKSFWNKSSFAFWTDPELCEGRPLFKLKDIQEVRNGDLVYVKGCLIKPETIQKALKPLDKFQPPKPTLAGFTELFDIQDLWKWTEPRLPVAIEPKLNGFRAIAHKKGDRVELWFEGQLGKDASERIPGTKELLRGAIKAPVDWVLDVDVAIEKNDKRLPRIELTKLNADKPVLEQDEKLVITAFDAPYLDADLTEMPFENRRELLQQKVKGLPITPIRWVKDKNQLKSAAQWAFKEDRSEGVMAKSARGKYELDGSTNEWSKLKRIAELKVIVLNSRKADGSTWNYECGLLPGDTDWINTTKYDDRDYINLGATFNTSIKAQPGEILTVEILELIPDDEKKKLSWLGARVIDVDKSRTQPYFAQQAIDIARRAQVLQKQVKTIPIEGPIQAPVAFIGSSPGRIEWARLKPMAGDNKELFDSKYLVPLGLSRKDVVVGYAVPILLTDEDGRVREPVTEEIEEWRDALYGELDRLMPKVVVALGQKAKQALGDRADFVVPHPTAIRRYGDSGEIERKIKRIKPRLEIMTKQRDEEGGETRGERAQLMWEDHWQEYLPKSGKGRFVYQHHWMGLNEQESKLSEKVLFDTKHALHGDLRLEGEGGLWGWAVFLGEAKENAKVGGDRLFALKEDQNLRLAPKLLQPKEWLRVGTEPKGRIVKPGESGATATSYAKFFALDEGTYELGVCLQHACEIFLDGKNLRGRFMVTYPRLRGERVWLIDKPESQTPRAETDDLADVISEQKRKGRDFVVWTKPGEIPATYNTRTGETIKSEFSVAISKADPLKKIVYGVVMDPYGSNGAQPDAHNDWMSPAEIEKAAHLFMKGNRTIAMQHGAKANANVVECWVEPYLSRDEYLKAMKGLPHKVARRPFGNDVLHSGSWVLGVELGDAEWNAYKDGEITAFSPGALGVRSPMTLSMMPDVKFVDLVAR